MRHIKFQYYLPVYNNRCKVTFKSLLPFTALTTHTYCEPTFCSYIDFKWFSGIFFFVSRIKRMPIFFFIFLYVLRRRKINKHVLDQLGNSCSQEFCARSFLGIKSIFCAVRTDLGWRITFLFCSKIQQNPCENSDQFRVVIKGRFFIHWTKSKKR